MARECNECIALLVQLHEQLEKIQANKKGLKRLRQKVKTQKKRIESAENLIESQDALITLLMNHT